jgi:general secretion pathway protein K
MAASPAEAGSGSVGAAGRPGFAILLVLWLLLFLALVATVVATTGRREARIASRELLSAEAETAADGGVHEAIWRVAGGLDEGTASQPLPGFALDLGGANVRVRIEDEAGKINPNTAPPGLLSALFLALGQRPSVATALAESIVEWRDPKPDPAQAMAVAERYRAAGREDLPPHAPFGSLDDLQGVLGMTAELLEGARPHLTLDQDGPPDPALADPVVGKLLERLPQFAAKPVPAKPGTVPTRIVAIDSRGIAGGVEFFRHAVVAIGGGRSFAILRWEAPARP